MSNSPKDWFIATNYGDFKSETLWASCAWHVNPQKKSQISWFFPWHYSHICAMDGSAPCSIQAVDPIVAYDHCLTSGWWCTNHLEKWWSSSMAFGSIIPFFEIFHNKSHVPKHQPDIHQWCIMVYPFLLTGLLELSMIISDGLQPQASTEFCGEKDEP